MIVRTPIQMTTLVSTDIAGGHFERTLGVPEREFRPRESFVIDVSATAIGATKCAGPRFRIEQVMLPSTVGYRFALGIVVDNDREQRKLAKTYPLHGATLSEMSPAMPINLYVKERLEIYVKRYAIKPSYRFLGETPRRDREQLSINTTRPNVKEPPTVNFVGSIRLLLAPPDGWN